MTDLSIEQIKAMFEAMDYAANQKRSNMWAEYDSAAEWCAKRNLSGDIGTPLPTGLSAECLTEINTHPAAFAERVKMTAYAIAMEKH